MKQVFFFSLFICSFLFPHAQSFETTTDRNGQKMFKGFVSDSILLADTASFSWFPEAQKTYTPTDNIVKEFAAKKDSVNYLAFFGTWCPDSRYIIPRFYKIIESAGINKNHISLYAVDRTKKDASNFASNFSVTNVPTIIVLKNGKEIGRVVEYGASGRFDEELASIVAAAK